MKDLLDKLGFDFFSLSLEKKYVTENEFVPLWMAYSDLKPNKSTRIIGSGDTPEEALENLIKELKNG